MSLDVEQIRKAFPFLQQPKALVYLDNAATTQKPDVVLQAMTTFYASENGNAKRGMHPLTESATLRWEESRKTVAKFLHAPRPETIVFTKSCTESLNLIARSLGETWKRGDIVVISLLEHHSNIVPWQQLVEKIGIELRWIPCDQEGTLDPNVLDEALATGKVKLVSITAQSNVLGVRLDLQTIIKKSHDHGALVCIDAAQAIAHGAIDVQELECDLLVFSGHKIFGPIGIGVLYGTQNVLELMPPFFGGGGMVQEVTQNGFTVADVPEKFEAGTLPIADAVGLAAGIRWLEQFSRDEVNAYEDTLIRHACETLQTVPGLQLLGPRDATKRFGCVSFTIDGVHPHDLTEVIGRKGFCLRAGHLCAMPLHKALGVNASTRLSVTLYNTTKELDECVEAIKDAVNFLRKG